MKAAGLQVAYIVDRSKALAAAYMLCKVLAAKIVMAADSCEAPII